MQTLPTRRHATRSRSPASPATSATSRSRSSRCSAASHDDDRPQRAVLRSTNGNFLFAAQDLNQLSGKPFEITGFHGRGGLQLVIAKANTGGAATQLRYQLYDGLESDRVRPAARARASTAIRSPDGATAVAAEDPFRPLAPEDYTSVGGDLPIYFDSGGQPAAAPRRPPRRRRSRRPTAGNTTFFSPDSKLDPDTQPNFFGTSAAAPHAAGDRGAGAAGAAGGV